MCSSKTKAHKAKATRERLEAELNPKTNVIYCNLLILKCGGCISFYFIILFFLLYFSPSDQASNTHPGLGWVHTRAVRIEALFSDRVHTDRSTSLCKLHAVSLRCGLSYGFASDCTNIHTKLVENPIFLSAPEAESTPMQSSSANHTAHGAMQVSCRPVTVSVCCTSHTDKQIYR